LTGAAFFYGSPDAPRPNRPLGVGVLALIERDGELLLERRSDCGRWGLIGGAVESEEGLEEALAREVLEETGLVVEVRELFGVSADPSRRVRYPDGNVVRVIAFVYKARATDFSTLLPSEESEELRFFAPEDLVGLDIIETARPIVDRYLRSQEPHPDLLLD
jgi:ADP-ribose pyrophosphatase YjhB (NUDIX family)